MSTERTVIDLTNTFHVIDTIEIIDSPVQCKKTISKTSLKTKPQVLLLPPPKESVQKLKKHRCIGFGDCPICWDELGVNQLASTKCGHVYCLKCLEKYIQQSKKCPTCRRPLTGASAYHPIYLSRN